MNEDDLGYLRFIGPAVRDKAIHTLKGILQGMSFDGVFNKEEIKELTEWYTENASLIRLQPFCEILPMIKEYSSDGIVTKDEFEDILWLLNNSAIESEYYDEVTTKIQELHGIFHGILADGLVNHDEFEGVKKWILENDHLKGVYPFDEVESLVLSIARAGTISEKEHETIVAFFESFISYSLSKRVNQALRAARGQTHLSVSIKGVCAIDPVVKFSERIFVFTGLSERGSRSQMIEEVVKRGGKPASSIVTHTDYLVVGRQGSRAWAFTCYGRKIERAMELRREGRRICIVDEVDFWDALN